MTATRPVTTPNLHCAPPCAKPADHHDTPHQRRAFFNAAQKKEQRRAPKLHIADKDPSPQRERRRSTTAGWGRIFFRRSSARTAPFCVAITTATFPESRFFHACFFRVMLRARAAAGGLRCVRGRQAKGRDARRGA
jgi:hypothetical protein